MSHVLDNREQQTPPSNLRIKPGSKRTEVARATWSAQEARFRNESLGTSSFGSLMHDPSAK